MCAWRHARCNARTDASRSLPKCDAPSNHHAGSDGAERKPVKARLSLLCGSTGRQQRVPGCAADTSVAEPCDDESDCEKTRLLPCKELCQFVDLCGYPLDSTLCLRYPFVHLPRWAGGVPTKPHFSTPREYPQSTYLYSPTDRAWLSFLADGESARTNARKRVRMSCSVRGAVPLEP